MKLGLIVPYRDRKEHLKIFIPHMEEYFKKHNINYHIYIIHQQDNYLFNRGTMSNIGFSIAENDVDYVIIHDVDTLVQNKENIYYFREFPCCLIYSGVGLGINKSSVYFGGVNCITKKHFKQINGFSNNFWGWGGEDGDFRRRIEQENIKWTRESKANHKLLPHSRENTGYKRFDEKNSIFLKGNINIHNIDKICNLGKQNKLNYHIDGYKQIDYKINSIEKITENSTMFNIKNNNVPRYDVNKPISEKFLNTLLKDKYKKTNI